MLYSLLYVDPKNPLADTAFRRFLHANPSPQDYVPELLNLILDLPPSKAYDCIRAVDAHRQAGSHPSIWVQLCDEQLIRNGAIKTLHQLDPNEILRLQQEQPDAIADNNPEKAPEQANTIEYDDMPIKEQFRLMGQYIQLVRSRLWPVIQVGIAEQGIAIFQETDTLEAIYNQLLPADHQAFHTAIHFDQYRQNAMLGQSEDCQTVFTNHPAALIAYMRGDMALNPETRDLLNNFTYQIDQIVLLAQYTETDSRLAQYQKRHTVTFCAFGTRQLLNKMLASGDTVERAAAFYERLNQPDMKTVAHQHPATVLGPLLCSYILERYVLAVPEPTRQTMIPNLLGAIAASEKWMASIINNNGLKAYTVGLPSNDDYTAWDWGGFVSQDQLPHRLMVAADEFYRARESLGQHITLDYPSSALQRFRCLHDSVCGNSLLEILLAKQDKSALLKLSLEPMPVVKTVEYRKMWPLKDVLCDLLAALKKILDILQTDCALHPLSSWATSSEIAELDTIHAARVALTHFSATQHFVTGLPNTLFQCLQLAPNALLYAHGTYTDPEPETVLARPYLCHPTYILVMPFSTAKTYLANQKAFLTLCSGVDPRMGEIKHKRYAISEGYPCATLLVCEDPRFIEIWREFPHPTINLLFDVKNLRAWPCHSMQDHQGLLTDLSEDNLSAYVNLFVLPLVEAALLAPLTVKHIQIEALFACIRETTRRKGAASQKFAVSLATQLMQVKFEHVSDKGTLREKLETVAVMALYQTRLLQHCVGVSDAPFISQEAFDGGHVAVNLNRPRHIQLATLMGLNVRNITHASVLLQLFRNLQIQDNQNVVSDWYHMLEQSPEGVSKTTFYQQMKQEDPPYRYYHSEEFTPVTWGDITPWSNVVNK